MISLHQNGIFSSYRYHSYDFMISLFSTFLGTCKLCWYRVKEILCDTERDSEKHFLGS